MEGFIEFGGYYLEDRNSYELTMKNKGPDSYFLDILKTQENIKVMEFATSVPFKLYDRYEYEIGFASQRNVITLKGTNLTKIKIHDIISIRSDLGVFIRTELNDDEFWNQLEVNQIYHIHGWAYGGDCGGTVYDYVGNPKLATIVNEMNEMQKKYSSISKELPREEKIEWYTDWNRLFHKVLNTSLTIVFTSTCND